MYTNDSSRTSNGGHVAEQPQREMCQMQVGDRICGETQTLQITREFRQLYENKLQQIDTLAGGDCAQAKIGLLQDWIRDLTEQNDMLVRAVEELELEATERVQMLEEKLRNSANSSLEVMKKYNEMDLAFNIEGALQRVVYLQNDVQNLVEFIRRIREDGIWNTDGLHFHEVVPTDLLGSPSQHSSQNGTSKENRIVKESISKTTAIQEDLIHKNVIMSDLQSKMDRLKAYGDFDEIINQLNDIVIIKKSMAEMREALTAEVAEKHDAVLSLRREVQLLEEQCRQAEKQAVFKDDIIKELRKELRQLRQPQKPMSPPPADVPESPKSFSYSSPSIPFKDHIIRHDLNEFFYMEDKDKKPVVIKHGAAKIDPHNSTVIYIREQSKPQKKRNANKLELLNKPGKLDFMTGGRRSIQSYITPSYKSTEPEIEVVKEPPNKDKPKYKNTGEYKTEIQGNSYVRETEKDTSFKKHNLRSRNTLRRSDLFSRLQASIVANYCYIPGRVEDIYNTSRYGKYDYSNQEEKWWD